MNNSELEELEIFYTNGSNINNIDLTSDLNKIKSTSGLDIHLDTLDSNSEYAAVKPDSASSAFRQKLEDVSLSGGD